MKLLTRIYPKFLDDSGNIIYLCKDLVELSDEIPEDNQHFSIEDITRGIEEDKEFINIHIRRQSEDYIEYEFSSLLVVKEGRILMILQEGTPQVFACKDFTFDIKILYKVPENLVFNGSIILEGFIGNNPFYTNLSKDSINTRAEANSRIGFKVSEKSTTIGNTLSLIFQGLNFCKCMPVLTISGLLPNGDSGLFLISYDPIDQEIENIWIDPVNMKYYTKKASDIRILGYERVPVDLYGDFRLDMLRDMNFYSIPDTSSRDNYIIDYKNGNITTILVRDLPTYMNGGFAGTTEADRERSRQEFISRGLPNFDKHRYVVFQTEDFIAYIDFYGKILSIFNRSNKYFTRFILEYFEIYESLYGFVTKVAYELDSNFKPIGNYKGYYISLSSVNRVGKSEQLKYKIFGNLYVPYYNRPIKRFSSKEFLDFVSNSKDIIGYWNESLLARIAIEAKYLLRLVYMP